MRFSIGAAAESGSAGVMFSTNSAGSAWDTTGVITPRTTQEQCKTLPEWRHELHATQKAHGAVLSPPALRPGW